MIKDFFIKKENIFIFVVALISIFFVVLGFLFLFFKTDSNTTARVIPNDVSEITWDKFGSKLLNQKFEYPDYLYVYEQEEGSVGINITEFEVKTLLDYFSNQNHFSIFPSGIDMPLLYGKTKDSEYVSESGQKYKITEYVTIEEETWGTMFVPEVAYKDWQSKGFIWLQSKIQNKVEKCITDKGVILENVDCDVYQGQKVIYSGKVSDQFSRTGYEIINKNYFK